MQISELTKNLSRTVSLAGSERPPLGHEVPAPIDEPQAGIISRIGFPLPLIKGAPELKSVSCTQAQLESKPFLMWRERFGLRALRYHRKDWEFQFIAQALHERQMLQPGKRGLALPRYEKHRRYPWPI